MTSRAVYPHLVQSHFVGQVVAPPSRWLDRPSGVRLLLAALWVVGLGLLGAAVYLAPEAAARLMIGLAIGAPAAWLLWTRPELGLPALALVTTGLVRRDLVTFPVAGIRLDPADVALMLLLAAFVTHGLRRRSLEIPGWAIGGPLIAFAGFALLSALYARFYLHVNLGLAIGELRPAVYSAGCAVVAATAVRRGRLALLLGGLFVVADLTAGAVILGHFSAAVRNVLPSGAHGLWQIDQSSAGGPASGATRLVPPGHVLVYLMANVACCLMVAPLRSRWLRAAVAVQMVVLGLGLLFTYTRAQWIASAIALVLVFLLLPGASRRMLGRVLLAAAPVLALLIGLVGTGLLPASTLIPGGGVSSRASSILQPGSTFGSASLQWRAFEDGVAIKVVRAHPLLGVGLGNDYRQRTLLQGEASGWLYDLSGPSSLTRFVHNGYLYLAVKLGLVGFGLFIAFCLAFLLAGARTYFSMAYGSERLVVLAIVCSFAGLLVWGVFEPHFMLASSMAAVGIAAGIVMAAERRRPYAGSVARHSREPRIPERPPRGEPGAPAGFGRGLLMTGTGAVVSLVLLFVELLILARALPTGVYGGYVLLVAVVNLLVMLSDFGCKVAVTQLISSGERNQQESVVATALAFRIAVLAVMSVLTLLAWVLLAAVAPFSAFHTYPGYLLLMLAPASLDELLIGMLQGFHAYRTMAAAQIMRSVLRIALTVFFLGAFRAGIAAPVYSWAVSFALAVVFEYRAIPARKLSGRTRATLLAMLRFGRPLQAMRFLGFVSDRLHVTVLGVVAGASGVAYFAVAAKIPDALQTLSDVYFRVYFPTISTMLADGRRRAAELLFARSLRLLSFVTALGAAIAAVFSRELVTVLFSAKYAASAPVFALLMVALHMTILVNVMGYTLTAAGRPGRALWLDVGQAAALAIGDVAFIPTLGAVGAAVAALVGSYASGPVGGWLARRSRFPIDIACHVKQTLLLWLCVALGWWELPAGAVAGMAFRLALIGLFVLLSVLLSTITRDDIGLIFAQRPGSSSRRIDRPVALQPTLAE